MLVHDRQLMAATGLTRLMASSACDLPRDAPVEPARPHGNIIPHARERGQRARAPSGSFGLPRHCATARHANPISPPGRSIHPNYVILNSARNLPPSAAGRPIIGSPGSAPELRQQGSPVRQTWHGRNHLRFVVPALRRDDREYGRRALSRMRTPVGHRAMLDTWALNE